MKKRVFRIVILLGVVVSLCRFDCGLVNTARDNPNDSSSGGYLESRMALSLSTGEVINRDDIWSCQYENRCQPALITLVFNITNNGSGPLMLSGTPRVSLAGSSTYTVLLQPSGVIAAGNTTSFEIRFNSDCAHVNRSTLVSIPTNDGTFTFEIEMVHVCVNPGGVGSRPPPCDVPTCDGECVNMVSWGSPCQAL